MNRKITLKLVFALGLIGAGLVVGSQRAAAETAWKFCKMTTCGYGNNKVDCILCADGTDQTCNYHANCN